MAGSHDRAKKQIRRNGFRGKLRRNAAAGKQRAHFGGKQEGFAGSRVIERLDAQGIARKKYGGCTAVASLGQFDHGKGKHAAEFCGAIFAPLLVGVDDYFGVRARAKLVAGSFQLLAQFAEIINFAVVDNGERAGLVPNGLGATGKINDAETAGGGHDGRRDENSLFIGAAMNDGGKHAADERLAGFIGVEADGTANSTHRASPTLRFK